MFAFAGCGSSPRHGPGSGARPAPAAPGTVAAVPTPTPTPRPDHELAIGITEANANFVWAEPHAVPAPFDRWRTALGAMHPERYRLMVDWATLQPDPAGPANLDLPDYGCMRRPSPCAGWLGLREQLRALASRQRQGGWEALVVLWGTPAWAAQPAAGCERPGTHARSRPPRPEALAAYRRLVADVLAAATQAGAKLRYWAPWNEPNHPFGISPQRARCSTTAPSAAVAPYARFADALRAELAAHSGSGPHELVLGELAGLTRLAPRFTNVRDFIRALPRELVCSATVFGQHGYVGGPDPVDSVAAALGAFRCPRRHEIWITETGAGGPRTGVRRHKSPAALHRTCEQMHARLTRWYADPRVTAAFQYTLREDPAFPTGLVTSDLSSAYPALRLWQAWGARGGAAAPPPRDPCRP